MTESTYTDDPDAVGADFATRSWFDALPGVNEAMFEPEASTLIARVEPDDGEDADILAHVLVLVGGQLRRLTVRGTALTIYGETDPVGALVLMLLQLPELRFPEGNPFSDARLNPFDTRADAEGGAA
jgi:hypothetical protein